MFAFVLDHTLFGSKGNPIHVEMDPGEALADSGPGSLFCVM